MVIVLRRGRLQSQANHQMQSLLHSFHIHDKFPPDEHSLRYSELCLPYSCAEKLDQIQNCHLRLKVPSRAPVRVLYKAMERYRRKGEQMIDTVVQARTRFPDLNVPSMQEGEETGYQRLIALGRGTPPEIDGTVRKLARRIYHDPHLLKKVVVTQPQDWPL